MAIYHVIVKEKYGFLNSDTFRTDVEAESKNEAKEKGIIACKVFHQKGKIKAKKHGQEYKMPKSYKVIECYIAE